VTDENVRDDANIVDSARDERTRAPKSDAAFRTISEVAAELNVPQHVLRFWETKFSQVRPLKRGGGRRYYRPEDVVLLKRIRGLLYTDGMTIKGVQKLLRDTGVKVEIRTEEVREQRLPLGEASAFSRQDAEKLLTELTGMRDQLRAALRAA
jgi:DNA-binding transcriptional MerR regulator